MSSNIITLNVGGTKIQTYKSTIEVLPYFESYMARWKIDNTNHELLAKDPKKNVGSIEIFVDYDPRLFIHLLNKLRDSKYAMPLNENIITMCNYFGYELETPKLLPSCRIIIVKTESQTGKRMDRNGTCTESYTINTIETPLSIIAIRSRGHISVPYIDVKDECTTLYAIDTDNFHIYFEQHQQHIEYWFLKKDIIETLQEIERLNIMIDGKYDETSIYIKKLI
jgi:hypothetical protein